MKRNYETTYYFSQLFLLTSKLKRFVVELTPIIGIYQRMPKNSIRILKFDLLFEISNYFK